mgnify:FL=1
MDNDEWQKHGRDAAREDIAGGAPPCTTIAEARKRIRAWITTDSWQPDTVAITADEAEACAAAYLATWQARAGTSPDNTSPAGLDLDAIEARYRDAVCEVGDSDAWRSAEDVPALVAEVRRLTAAHERMRAAAAGVTDGFRAMLDDIRAGADDAARTANAERVRGAFATLAAEVLK